MGEGAVRLPKIPVLTCADQPPPLSKISPASVSSGFWPISSRRSPQAALKFSYRSDRSDPGLTCGIKSARYKERDADFALDAPEQGASSLARNSTSGACKIEQQHVVILVQNKGLSQLDQDNM